jgi:hypothetical protein
VSGSAKATFGSWQEEQDCPGGVERLASKKSFFPRLSFVVRLAFSVRLSFAVRLAE